MKNFWEVVLVPALLLGTIFRNSLIVAFKHAMVQTVVVCKKHFYLTEARAFPRASAVCELPETFGGVASASRADAENKQPS